jgi:DNA-binding PadR family transcriptional regulator
MAFPEVVLAVLRRGPAHGYNVKHEYDSWFPDARPVGFGQVYSTLARLQRDGLVEIAETCAGGGPERTVYTITPAGEERLSAWLAEPAPGDSPYGDEIVRKTVAALRTGAAPNDFLARQRTAHLRRIRELTSVAPEAEEASRLARDHMVAHLDADLRWLDLAVDRIAAGGS